MLISLKIKNKENSEHVWSENLLSYKRKIKQREIILLIVSKNLSRKIK